MTFTTPELKCPADQCRTIAVFRALQLGDLLCTVPAWRALRNAYPDAHIALIGLPWAAEFVSRFRRYFDDFIEFPGYPGLPERAPQTDRIPEFLQRMQSRRFDLLIQMHGNGRYANGVVTLCGPRRLAGYYQKPEPCPDVELFIPYPDGLPEVRRHLALMESLGIPPCGEHLEFPLTDADRTSLESALGPARMAQPYICIHPGGRRPANRWGPDKFADVADSLSHNGWQVVLTGTAAEVELGEAVASAMKTTPVNLVGRTSLGGLAVLLSRARLLVSNDTGASHVAAALEVPSVIVSIGSDPIRWSPLNADRHRVLVGKHTEPDVVRAECRALLAGTPTRGGDTSALRRPRRSARASGSSGARRLRVLTWHVHGNYLYYLSHTPHDFVLPVGRKEPGYAGCAPGFPWPSNVREIALSELPHARFDCILFQSRRQYLVDQFDILTDAQRALPRLYLEHDPPQEHATDQFHPVNDPDMLLVHVTHFNRLMWNNGRTPSCVVEHGVVVPEGLPYIGDIQKGLVIVNHLHRRGRRLGADLYDYVRARVPLDLVGMDSTTMGGLGEIDHHRLPELMCRYRFVLHPIRYTSLGLALCEAMALGVPPVALATTEAPVVIQHGVSGFVDTNVDRLIEWMQLLLGNPQEARRIGDNARRVARTRFAIERFAQDWDQTLTGFVTRRAGARAGTSLEEHVEILR